MKRRRRQPFDFGQPVQNRAGRSDRRRPWCRFRDRHGTHAQKFAHARAHTPTAHARTHARTLPPTLRREARTHARSPHARARAHARVCVRAPMRARSAALLPESAGPAFRLGRDPVLGTRIPVSRQYRLRADPPRKRQNSKSASPGPRAPQPVGPSRRGIPQGLLERGAEGRARRRGGERGGARRQERGARIKGGEGQEASCWRPADSDKEPARPAPGPAHRLSQTNSSRRELLATRRLGFGGEQTLQTEHRGTESSGARGSLLCAIPPAPHSPSHPRRG